MIECIVVKTLHVEEVWGVTGSGLSGTALHVAYMTKYGYGEYQ